VEESAEVLGVGEEEEGREDGNGEEGEDEMFGFHGRLSSGYVRTGWNPHGDKSPVLRYEALQAGRSETFVF
jgi:hypothetical protein